VYVLVDENTKEHCLPVLFQNLDFFSDAEIIEIESGEDSKSIDICYQLWGMMLETGATRNSVLVNLGGGVICDLGGFIASTFKRGIDFINIPTTLLAQVDAAIGGKTGVNFEGIKNQIGLFNHSALTFIDADFLATLNPREFNSGLAEIIKYGLIDDAQLYMKLKETKVLANDLSDVITACVDIKNRIVANDFNDKGDRKKLNFGHTIGHAIETYFKGEVLHGEAVAAGIISETYISYKTNGFNEESLLEVKTLIETYFEKLSFSESDFAALLDLMSLDKKNSEEGINFTLLNSIGESSINHFISDESIIESLMFYLK
jgi:3-dehydroquinate synthase